MTVSSELNRKQYTGNGVTTSFATSPVVFFDSSDLDVYVVTTATGAATLLTETTDYTVTGGAGSTGTVATTGLYGAPSASQTLVIVRNVPLTQATDFVQNDASDAEVVEDALDKLTMAVQQVDARVDRSFVLADSDVSGASLTVPTPAANNLVGWNSAATGLENKVAADIDLAVVSPFIETLLDDTTAAAARTTLDVPSNAEAILDTLIDAKGDIIVGTAADTPARKAVGSNGQLIVADSTQSDGLIWTDYTRPAMNINPDWQIDQINEGGVYAGTSGTVVGPDGWSLANSGASAGRVSMTVVADPDNAALKALKLIVTTTQASMAAGDAFHIFTALEGYDVAALQPGISSASKITVMFKATLPAGTYGVSIANSAANRSNIQAITGTGAEATYTLTFQLDTTGTWLYTNGVGLYLRISLACGSNSQSAAGAWAAGNYFSTSAQTNALSAANTMYIKRVHVIPGGVALAYAPADIQRELAKAQRHYEKSYTQGTAVGTAVAAHVAPTYYNNNAAGFNSVFSIPISFNTTKRATPTVTTYSPGTGTSGKVQTNDAGNPDRTSSVNNTHQGGFSAGLNQADAGSVMAFHWGANARLS